MVYESKAQIQTSKFHIVHVVSMLAVAIKFGSDSFQSNDVKGAANSFPRFYNTYQSAKLRDRSGRKRKHAEVERSV